MAALQLGLRNAILYEFDLESQLSAMSLLDSDKKVANGATAKLFYSQNIGLSRVNGKYLHLPPDRMLSNVVAGMHKEKAA